MSHKCRSGKHCAGRTSDGPAQTTKPHTICNGCTEDIQRRRKDLPELVDALGSFVRRTPQSALQSKVSRSLAPQPPCNVEVLSVRDEAKELLARVGNVLVRDLVKRAPERYPVFRHGRFTEAFLDGCDLALEIRRLHARTESMVGLAPTYERRRAPCPRCGLTTLGTIVGSGLISCSSADCQWCGPTSEYEAHCKYKAEKNG